jgi:hypothetical protein
MNFSGEHETPVTSLFVFASTPMETRRQALICQLDQKEPVFSFSDVKACLRWDRRSDTESYRMIAES